MTLELNSETIKWVLEKMEAITKDVMLNSTFWTREIITKKTGEFAALSELLADSGLKIDNIKFKIEYRAIPEEKTTSEQK
jgi:hypothetical protein